MTIRLTDQGEYEMLQEAYDGAEMIVGLYNEKGSDRDNTPQEPEDSSSDDNEVIDDVNFDFIIGGGGSSGGSDDGETFTPQNDKVSLTEAGLESTVRKTEPDRTKGYARQSVTVSADNIRRASGFSTSKDLTGKLTLPPVTFNVEDNTREVNAVFVMFKKSGNIHFNSFLDRRLVLDNFPVDAIGETAYEVTINNIELLIE